MNPHTLAALILLGIGTTVLAQQTRETKRAEGASGTVSQVWFSPDGKQIVTTWTNSSFQIWDLKSGKPLLAQPAPLGTWRLVSFKYGDTSDWTDAPPTQRRIKLITPTHFTWVEYEVSSGKVQSSAGGLTPSIKAATRS